MTGVHGILLTGGSSARMSSPKALLQIAGRTLAQRAADALGSVADPVVAVGIDARLGLECVEDPQKGPLWALRAGYERLEEMSCAGRVLLLGCDLPLVNTGLLALLAEQLDGYDAAVPVVEGQPQPVAACYAPYVGAMLKDPHARPGLNTADLRSMKDLLGLISVRFVPPEVWQLVAADQALLDVNTPADLRRARQLAGGPAS
ncbi:MAG: molybdenum cofactor guanylyltransferase [Actinomycetota bacterium]